MDVDGDELTYNVSTSGSSLATISNNILTITPIYGVNEVATVMIIVSDGIMTDSTSFSFTTITFGCTASDCCNYNPNANVDDGSCVCIDLSEGYDCDGNCILEIDCAGECGGNLELDECGVCGGDNTSCEILGDMNGDGILNVVDIIHLVNFILDNSPYSPIADFNEDGYVNVVDIISLISLILYP